MFISHYPKSIILHALWCTKVGFDDNLNAVSRAFIHDLQFKRFEKGVAVETETFETEEERIDVIRREFGITLNEEEQDAIKNSKLAVKKYNLRNRQFKY